MNRQTPTAEQPTKQPRAPIRRVRVAAVVIALAIVLAALIPQLPVSGFVLASITAAMLLAVRAQGWNVIGGYAGYAAFGNVAFYGLGAYGTALLMTRAHWPFVPAMLAGALVAALYAAIVGLPVLKMRGQYFAIATLGVAEATRELVASPQLAPLTAGPTGVSLPFYRPAGLSGAEAAQAGNLFFYYVALALVVASALVTWLVARSRLGYALIAIREDEDAARMLGVDTTRAKVAAFALSAFITALAGGHYAYWRTFILPEEVFSVRYTLEAILAAVLGGSGTVAGPVVGAGVYDVMSTYLTFAKPFGFDLGPFHVTLLGVLIVAAAVLLPRGIGSLIRNGRPSLAVIKRTMREYRA